MPKPACRILVINDEHLVLREFVKGLNAAARALDNPLGISFIGVDHGQGGAGRDRVRRQPAGGAGRRHGCTR